MDTEDFPTLLPVLGLGLFEDGTKTNLCCERIGDDFMCWDVRVGDKRKCDDNEGNNREKEELGISTETAQSRQKSYVDRRRPYLEFQVGDRVLLEVSLWKRVIRFRKRGKLGPRFIRPFTVLARMGRVAYRLELPEVFDLSRSTFHVSQLSKCLAGESAHIPLDDIQVGEGLNCVERPVAVLERRMKGLRNKEL
ncbi:hypothetical protein OSB04_020205 [Centaurea solstitialis]|uniref:Tf2-1-like SH3-like domain-containing protein n=1 Tax=Centaurea solstitialis TaxID=347529 RepID=A0AA38TA81_9ASTR|nr:hypothetical protein OSB04_020205 [Centaurea solstitialis]